MGCGHDWTRAQSTWSVGRIDQRPGHPCRPESYLRPCRPDLPLRPLKPTSVSPWQSVASML